MGTKLVAILFTAATVAAAQTVTASASPNALTFNYQIGAALPPAQTVSVRASSGTPSYTLAVSPATALWLTATPDSGKLPASLSVRVNPTGMAVGQYTATVNITVTGIASVVSVAVTLNVTAPLPTLALSTNSATFVTSPVPALTAIISLSTSGNPVSFSASVTGASWLTVSPTTGVVLPGSEFPLLLTADATGLAPSAKAYAGKITLTAYGVPTANKTQTITANLTVNAATPTISSLWPNSVQANTGAATITVRGSNFYSATAAKAGTTPLTTTILGPNVLQAVIPATMLTAAGPLNIVVSNPAPGGDSAPAVFTVSNAPVIQAIVNAASYGSNGSVSPGEIVAIFGLGIGPASPVYMSTATNPGYLDTAIGGLSVTIDSQPAPLLYADANQITVQVPYEATLGSNKAVVVTNGTATPSNTTVTIVQGVPGIFTADASGIGTAAAVVLPSGGGAAGLNSASFPAHAGDLVELYVTGEGDYLAAPAQHTGYIIPATLTPLPQVAPLPTVTIGTAPANVVYAGPLYGSVIGLLQMNVIVPAGLSPGNAPVVVTINGVQTQSNVTLAVK